MTIRTLKDWVKKKRRKNYVYFIYSYYKSLKFKIRPLFVGINHYLDAENIVFNLRRDIHRIEKGLTFKNTKDVFAEAYISNIIEALLFSYEKRTIDTESLEWSISVLEKYFSEVKKTSVIQSAYDLYRSVDLKGHDRGYIPYKELTRSQENITYDDILALSVRRRSIRFYEEKPVDLSLVMKAMEVAKLAPSACNRQAFRYLYYDKPDVASKIAAIPGGVKGYEIKNIFVLTGDYGGYFMIRDATAPIIDASLSAMALLYGLDTVGLGSVCINWPNEPDKEEQIRELIDLKPTEFVIMLIGVGYPDPQGKIPYSKKRGNEDFILVNEKIK